MSEIKNSDQIKLIIDDITCLNKDKINLLKNINQPKIGWFSIYTPEEIIYAAGLIPFRITGEEATTVSKARAAMFANICPYTLSCLEEGMQDVYNFIDGVVMVNTCDARRRLYDTWRHYVSNSKFIHLLDLPKFVSPESKDYFHRQIILFMESLQNYFGCKITEEHLKRAIELWDETRSLLNRLYDLRKKSNPSINGAQAINIVKASMTGLKELFNKKLNALLIQLENQEVIQKSKGLRILICGSYFDQTNLIELIERLGALVVCEDLSNGIKYFEGGVGIKGDPITALSNYYLEKASCARMASSERRFNHIWKLVQEYKVDAVIYFSLKFCDTNLIDFPYQKNKLNERNIPVLFLEGERNLINLEQIKTRIQAFFEKQFLEV